MTRPAFIVRASLPALLPALLGALAVVLTACSSSSSTAAAAKPSDLINKTASGPYDGFGLVPPLPRPAFTLTDTSGKRFEFGTQTAGKPTLLFFGYTQCPDVCPTTMLDIHDALTAVGPVVRSKVQVVFVSTDVKHDTRAAIASWLSKFDTGLPNRFIGLSGTQVQVDTAQAAAHVQLAEEDGRQHAANVLLYGSDDYARVQFLQSSNESDQIAHDLPLVVK